MDPLPRRIIGTESSTNLYKILLDHAKSNPDRVYYYNKSGCVTYEQIHSLSSHLAQQLRHDSRFSKQPILAASLNSNEAILYLTWACLASGICLAFLPVISDPAQIRSLMNQIGADVLLTDVAELKNEPWSLAYETLKNGILADGNHAITVADLPPDTPAFIFQTSGTTGGAKWVQITHSQFLMALECMKSVGVLDHKVDQIAYITPPLSHSYGLSSLLEYTSVGSSVVLPSGNSPLGPVGELIGSALAEIITAVEGVPHVYTQMVRLIERIKLPALRHIGFGGGGLDQMVLGRLRETYPKLTYSVRYGMTETPSVISHKLFSYPYDDDWASSGKSLPIYDLRIVDETDQVVDAGQQGEVQVKGACLAWPYYGETGTIDFFATGDMGYINAKQELCIVGRKSAFLKVQGYRISPEYIESIIATFDGIVDCRVLSVDTSILAEVVPAVDSFSTSALRTFLASKLPNYAIPQTITIVNEIPRTASGKIKRH